MVYIKKTLFLKNKYAILLALKMKERSMSQEMQEGTSLMVQW